MRDGEEKKVAAEVIFMYQVPEPEAGLQGGFFVAGLEVNGQFIELEDIHVKKNYGQGEKEYMTFVVDPQDAEKLWAIAGDLLNDAVSDPSPEGGE